MPHSILRVPSDPSPHRPRSFLTFCFLTSLVLPWCLRSSLSLDAYAHSSLAVGVRVDARRGASVMRCDGMEQMRACSQCAPDSAVVAPLL
ncbi:hypothetical protein B0H12DRAFT_1099148 [Mycena haematopus]|nr:hypothetical protein B0H12DRAFT_1099148 [Mycena haematopus]